MRTTCWRCGEIDVMVIDPILKDPRDSIGVCRKCWAVRTAISARYDRLLGTKFVPLPRDDG